MIFFGGHELTNDFMVMKHFIVFFCLVMNPPLEDFLGHKSTARCFFFIIFYDPTIECFGFFFFGRHEPTTK